MKTTMAGRMGDEWWQGAVGYEIYVRSFADGDQDGTGDLAGIESKLEYLSWLGIDAIWITPFFPSPGLDHGYDVSDYCAIDPQLGSMEDFDRLVAAAHGRGIRVVIDLVLNHTSSSHTWFQDAISAPDSEKRDYYIWREPANDGGPPNNWVSHFGGPAWTLDNQSGQYYCHLFLPEQPDLNWRNPAVRNAVDEIFVFWCERGVDGFRLDVAHGLSKHEDFPDNPSSREISIDMGPTEIFESFDHCFDLDQDENAAIYERWNKLVAPYGALLLGEVNAPTPDRIARFSDGDRLHRSFFLRPSWTSWDPAALIDMLRLTHDASPDGLGWVLNNHDQARSISRFGDGQQGLRRTKLLSLLLFGLGGIPFLYQGEELGLGNSEIQAIDREDPVWTRNDSSEVGRDVTRGPMPWSPGLHNGFSTSIPWLLEAQRSPEETVEVQRDDLSSALHWYRDILAFRKQTPDLWESPLVWLGIEGDLALAFRRGEAFVIANLGPEPVTVDLGVGVACAFASSPEWGSVAAASATVLGETTVVLQEI